MTPWFGTRFPAPLVALATLAIDSFFTGPQKKKKQHFEAPALSTFQILLHLSEAASSQSTDSRLTVGSFIEFPRPQALTGWGTGPQ